MSNLELTPLGRNLLVRCNEVSEKKVGSLYVPDNHSELSRVAEVLAKGEECTRPIKVGDKILLDYHSGTVIDIYYKGEATSVNDTFRIVDELAAQAIIVSKDQ